MLRTAAKTMSSGGVREIKPIFATRKTTSEIVIEKIYKFTGWEISINLPLKKRPKKYIPVMINIIFGKGDSEEMSNKNPYNKPGTSKSLSENFPSSIKNSIGNSSTVLDGEYFPLIATSNSKKSMAITKKAIFLLCFIF